MGEGSHDLSKNQQGLRVGCWAMVGDYSSDGSGRENLNLLLCLTRVEASIDLKELRPRIFLKDVFKSQGCWGLPQQLLATIGCFREFEGRFRHKSAHSRVAWRLKEIPFTKNNQVDSSWEKYKKCRLLK